MSRTERLLDLLQILRRHKTAIPGKELARELGVSIRTLYRDIATLQAQEVPIGGESGVGYLLQPGYTVPPLMFSIDELEALLLGVRWLVKRGDKSLALSARNALAKISAVIPDRLRDGIETSNLLVAAQACIPVDDQFTSAVRTSIREDRKLSIRYRDRESTLTDRTIWPFAVGFFDHVQLIAAWCEIREDFRYFRADRVESWKAQKVKYPIPHEILLKKWYASRNIPIDSES